jgi:F-type H+-transporting ATPase subunit gamma
MAGQSARDIKRRIRSVQNIGKVTRAMEAVSASKMRRAQQATLRSRAYATRAYEVAAHLRAQTGAGQGLHPLLDEHDAGVPVVLLITPDRGLTGGLVLNTIRYAVRKVHGVLGKDVKWVALGKKGRDFLIRHSDLVADFTPLPDAPTLLDISPVARLALDGFTSGEFKSVHVVFPVFMSISKQRPVFRQLLPIYVPPDAPVTQSGFTFEPSPEAVLDEMLPRLVELQVYQALLEAQASEHSARMLAMRNATDAANDLVGELTLTYNKARQASITAEILDIAGGAEALRQALAAE